MLFVTMREAFHLYPIGCDAKPHEELIRHASLMTQRNHKTESSLLLTKGPPVDLLLLDLI